MTLFSVVVSEDSVNVLELLPQVNVWCLFRHVFELRQPVHDLLD